MARPGSRQSFAPLFKDIGQDFTWALHNPEKLRGGGKLFRHVTYAEIEGFRPLMMDVSVPKGEGPHPVLVHIHGGAWRIGSPWLTNPQYRQMDFLGRLVKAGFAVASIAYRFTKEAPFPAQLHDCKAAIRYLRKHAAKFNIDPQRIGVFGDSAGGHLAMMVGLTGGVKAWEGEVGVTKGSSAVSCVINWFGPSNFLTMQKQKEKLPSLGDTTHPESPESWLMGGPLLKRKAQAKAASPVTHARRGAPPVLLQYGDADRLVPYEQGEELFEALAAKGCDVTLQRLSGADHCFWGLPLKTIQREVIARDIAFLKKHLG